MAGKPTYEELEQRIREFEKESLERKRTEESLRKSEGRLAGIVSSITDQMSMMDDRHNIVWANNVAKEMFGPRLVGRKCYRAYHRHNHPCESCVVKKCFDDGKVLEYETMITGRDGRKMVLWCVASVAAWHSDGRPKMVIEAFRDITGRKQTEEELRQACEELERQVKARTSELKASNMEVQLGHKELLKHKLELEKVNKELLETNETVSVLAQNISKGRGKAQKKMALTISSKIMPIVEQLRTAKTLEGRRTELDVLAFYLHDMTSSLTRGMDEFISFSPSEMTVAAMIKNGLTSRQIADRLYISLETIKTHRRNIRKKLKINNAKFSLVNYLRLKLSQTQTTQGQELKKSVDNRLFLQAFE